MKQFVFGIIFGNVKGRGPYKQTQKKKYHPFTFFLWIIIHCHSFLHLCMDDSHFGYKTTVTGEGGIPVRYIARCVSGCLSRVVAKMGQLGQSWSHGVNSSNFVWMASCRFASSRGPFSRGSFTASGGPLVPTPTSKTLSG